MARGNIGDTTGNDGSCVSLLSEDEEEAEKSNIVISDNNIVKIQNYLAYCWSLPLAVRPSSQSKDEIIKKFENEISEQEIDMILKSLHDKNGLFYLEGVVFCIFKENW